MSYIIKTGMSGNLITELQQSLLAHGALDAVDQNGASNIDGIFGRITKDAVKKFQIANNLAPDEIVGQATAKALNIVLPEPTALPAASSHVLTADQLRNLAEVIDSFIPFPFSLFCDSAIAFLVNQLDSALADLLPPSVLSLLNDLSNGIDGHDLGAFKKRLSVAINKRIDIPLLSEEIEGEIISFFVDLVVEALQTGRYFDGALAALRAKSVR